MKKDYQSLKSIFLSLTLVFGSEYLLVLLTNDHNPCFWHNTTIGIIIAWSIKLIVFAGFNLFFSQLFAPVYRTLKDRMIERDELAEKNNSKQEQKYLHGRHAYEA